MKDLAVRLSTADLLRRVRFYLFLPEDWRETRRKLWEEYQRKRADRGETDFAWKITEDEGEARGIREAGPALPGMAAPLQVVPPEEAASSTEKEEAPVPRPLRIRLRLARTARGLSQKEAGALFGVGQQTYAKWERGTEPDEEGRVRGKPIPRERVREVLQWIENGSPEGS